MDDHLCYIMLYPLEYPLESQEQMTWVDFQAQLENPHLQQLFHALDVDDSGAKLPSFDGRSHEFPVFMAKICPGRMIFYVSTCEIRTWFLHAEPD